MPNRSNPSLLAGQLALLVGAAVLAIAAAGSADWNLPLLVSLFAFSALSDLTAIDSPAAGIKLSGSFLTIVLAMVFLGGTPAAIIGVGSILVGWLRWREPPSSLLGNVVTYAWFPLLGGLAFDAARDALEVGRSDAVFYALIFALFALALVVNFAFVAAFACRQSGDSFVGKVRQVLVPGLPSEFPAALLALGVAYLYTTVGLAAIGLFGVVLFSFQQLLRRLFTSEQRREELELRTSQLSSFQVELLTILLRTLDLRDRMTARHSAAVARYAREIARAGGFSELEQDLVHTAALLHDIGKFELSDRILKGAAALSPDEWKVIRQHPARGAELVRQVHGYEEAAEIIRAHHERVDGGGYPHGLSGDDIPALARIIAVADAYDVMTARDSYRTPSSSADAVAELRRAAGTQFDARFVEIFAGLLADSRLRYSHGEEADFDAELALKKRFHGPAIALGGRAPEQALA